MTGIAKLIEVTSCRRDPSGVQRVTRSLDCRIVRKTRSKTRFRAVFDCFYFLTRPLPSIENTICYAMPDVSSYSFDTEKRLRSLQRGSVVVRQRPA